jgi:hypothetical protein
MIVANPPHWYNVYPQGTKKGDEEAKFFKVLARDPKYKWRSTSAIAKEAGLSKQRTEEIVSKYIKLGVIIPSKKNENSWAYWERVPKTLAAALDNRSIGQKDKDARIDSFGDEDEDAQYVDMGLCEDDDDDLDV